MKRLTIVLALLGTAAVAEAVERPFGLGLVLGEPTGITAKLYLPQTFALQFGAGVIDDFGNRDGWNFNVDFVWHPVVVARTSTFTMPFYLGVGGRLADDRTDVFVDNVRYVDHATRFGVRGPFGLLLDFKRVPLDVYFELAVVVDLVYFDEYGPFRDRDRVGLNGGVGLRYYF